MSFSAADRLFMHQAIRLAALGRGRTHPNPMVGCVIVNHGRVVGTGYHRRKGEPHAETFALREAGELARGATAYVSLEPCAHVGLTPPCAGSLVQAGVTRVVAAMVDPDPRVAGRGLEHLRSAGVSVAVGLLEDEARALNRAWLTWKTTGRPLVILKWASTLDGKIACATGDSRWVTSDEARAHLHQVRDQVDAILVGQNTVQRDNPELTARPAGPGLLPGWAGGSDPGPDPDWQPKDPLRIVLDSMARISLDARLLSPELAQRPRPNRTLVAHGVAASRLKLQALRERGADTLELPADCEMLALGALLDELGRRSITSLLVEGGARVHWSFLSQGLGDYLLIYAAPKIVGGAGAPGPVAGPGLSRMTDAWPVQVRKLTTIGTDLLVEGDLKHVHGTD